MWAAIAGDVLIVLAVVFLAGRVAGKRHIVSLDGRGWLVLVSIGLVFALSLEWLAQALDLWRYSELMPTVRIFGRTVGLSPIVQVTFLPAVSVRMAIDRPSHRL
jgi:uncharacterized membrane protein YeaQ/YmgE (transglycosylase-associated protein family)